MTVTLILVTFNRLALLKETLKAHLSMHRPFDEIIVVDNCSTDGTREYLDETAAQTPSLHVIHSPVNTGGAGGFALGMQYALEHRDPDWLFLADDDAVPQADMLGELLNGYESRADKENIAAVCTSVAKQGNYDPWQRKIVKRGLLTLRYADTAALYGAPFFVDEATFVGLMIKRDVALRVGTPDKDFFIYFDDTDYCYRLRKHGKILCLPKSVMRHDTKDRQISADDWRNFYGARNHLIVVKRCFPKRYFIVLKWLKYIKHASFPLVGQEHEKQPKNDPRSPA